MGIAVISNAGLAEIVRIDDAEGATGTNELNTLIEPSKPDGSVRCFIGAVHDRIANQLLQRRWRVVGSSFLEVRRGQIDAP